MKCEKNNADFAAEALKQISYLVTFFYKTILHVACLTRQYDIALYDDNKTIRKQMPVSATNTEQLNYLLHLKVSYTSMAYQNL